MMAAQMGGGTGAGAGSGYMQQQPFGQQQFIQGAHSTKSMPPEYHILSASCSSSPYWLCYQRLDVPSITLLCEMSIACADWAGPSCMAVLGATGGRARLLYSSVRASHTLHAPRRHEHGGRHGGGGGAGGGAAAASV